MLVAKVQTSQSPRIKGVWSQNGLLVCVCGCAGRHACACVYFKKLHIYTIVVTMHSKDGWLLYPGQSSIAAILGYTIGRYGNGFIHSTLHKHSLHIHMHTLLTHLAHTPYIATCISQACMATHAHLEQSTRISYLLIGNPLLVMYEAASNLPAGGNYH